MTTSKPAHTSRTLRFCKVLTWLSVALATVPDVIGYSAQLLGDPEIAALVTEAIPLRYRAGFGLILLIVAQTNRRLRMMTSTPISYEPRRSRRRRRQSM